MLVVWCRFHVGYTLPHTPASPPPPRLPLPHINPFPTHHTQHPIPKCLPHNTTVRSLMPPLIPCNGPTQRRQHIVAVLLCMLGGVSVADFGGPLLKGGVYKAMQGVLVYARFLQGVKG